MPVTIETLTLRFFDWGDGWITASVGQFPGVSSQGRTLEEVRRNVLDALVTILTPDDKLDKLVGMSE